MGIHPSRRTAIFAAVVAALPALVARAAADSLDAPGAVTIPAHGLRVVHG